MYQITGMVISNIVWGFFIKRKGTKKMTGDCILIGAILPILAIILSKFGPNIYAVLFFIIGFVASGRRITFEPYLLDIIPSNKRVTYLGIRGTLNILMIIMPLVGATIIKLFGYYFTFLLVSIVMFFAYYLLKKEN
jgi:MFS family permease